MKRPLTYLLLVIAIAWLLKFEQVSMVGATTGAEPICGNAICEAGENYNNCPLDCTQPVCGNNAVEKICNDPNSRLCEECDGIDDSLCPELCQSDCKCPPPAYRNYTLLPFRYTFQYDEIKPNEITTINLGRPKVDVQGAGIITNKSLQNALFILDSNVSTPAYLPGGIVHAYFQLQMGNSSQEQYLAYKEIFFRVPTTWTIEHKIQKIQLEYLNIQTWQPVQTDKLYQDLNYIYFSAKPEKLGLFATVSPPPPQKPIPVCGNGILEEGENSFTCCADAGCPQEQSCISNMCKFVAVCGNNICEPTENSTSCPADCAAVSFRGASASAIVLLLVALAVVTFYLSRKLPSLMPKKPIVRRHATPERWF